MDIEAVQLTDNNILEAYSFVYGKPDLSHNIASDKWDEYERIVRERGMDIKTLEDGEDGRAQHVASIGGLHHKRSGGRILPLQTWHL